MKSANPQQNLTLQQQFLAQFTSLPFDDLAATTFGTIRFQLEALGTASQFGHFAKSLS
jgi:tRNA(fMet)-specific endonuclease VapC